MWTSIAGDFIICFHYDYDTLEEVLQPDVSAWIPAVGEQVRAN